MPEHDVAPIRILIVDDSAVARATLAQAIADDPRFKLVAALDRAERALAWLTKNRADIVLLDIAMPGRSGLLALPDLLACGNGARVVIVSAFAAEGAAATIRALAMGVADAIAKPESGPIGRQFGTDLTERLLRLAERSPTLAPNSWHLRTSSSAPLGCVAIGASTGGIHALSAFFAQLPAGFDAPIFVTQHLPSLFMPSFAGQLSAMANRPCDVATAGTIVARGRIYLAPGHAHLECQRSNGRVAIALSQERTPSGCRPAVDAMFASVAATFGSSAMGIVFSGMGRDGAHGALALASAGCTIAVQDEASAVIWGMPGAIARAGLASLIAAPSSIADHVAWRGAAR